MNHQQAFNEMMIRFDIEAKKLALDSKVSEIQISRFRNGKQDLHADSLLRLLNSVSKEARQWYLSAVLGDAHLGTDVSSLVWNLNSQELSTLLHVVAEKLRSGKSAEALQVAGNV